jgi:Fe2+ or Zn2+ uptake regulation protein
MEGTHDVWLAETDAVLRDAGLRRAPGRAAVAAVLARGECLMSAADILRRLDDEPGLSASTATVYRTLDLLHAHGLLRRIDAGDGPRYEPVDRSAGETHQHVIFEDGSVEPFTDPALSRAMATLDDRLGIDVITIELVVRARRRG